AVTSLQGAFARTFKLLAGLLRSGYPTNGAFRPVGTKQGVDIMRRVLTAAAAAALALAISACGGDQGSGTAAPASSPVDPASVSGTVTWWDTSDATTEAPAFKELVAEFEAKYPKIKVNYVNVPFADAQ